MIDGFSSRMVRINLEFDDRFANYKGLKIIQSQIGHNIRGSVHKFHNNGEHNANDYTLTDFADTLNQIYNEIGLNPDITVLTTLEFGVNIKLPITPDRALNRLVLHKSNIGESKKGYREFKYKEYILKIYDKSGIEQIGGDILRIEIKVSKMRYIRDKQKVFVKTLSDLLDFEIWSQLEDILINAVEDCLFIEMTDQEIKNLTDKQKIQFHQYDNPKFWNDLHLVSRKKYHRERVKCEQFIKQFSTSTLKSDIISLMRHKCMELRDISEINDNVKKWDKITTLQEYEKHAKCDEITIKIKSDIVPPEKTPPTSPEPQTPDNAKRCATCGRIIENPRKGQKYCSATEVGYEAAHKCRNTASNPKNNTLRSIERVISIPLLFDLSETIAPDKLKYMESNDCTDIIRKINHYPNNKNAI